MTNLVPDDLLSSPSDSTYEPRRVLDEVAAELVRKTGGSVGGEVRTDYPYGDKVQHRFSLCAIRTNYKYNLFEVEHQIDEYPVTLVGPGQSDVQHLIKNRGELEQAIARIFAAPGTRKLIYQLAQMDT